MIRKGAESSPYGSQPYQLSLAIGINHVSKIERQFDSEMLNRTRVYKLTSDREKNQSVIYMQS